MKDRQHNGQTKNDKRTNNDKQNVIQKKKTNLMLRKKWKCCPATPFYKIVFIHRIGISSMSPPIIIDIPRLLTVYHRGGMGAFNEHNQWLWSVIGYRWYHIWNMTMKTDLEVQKSTHNLGPQYELNYNRKMNETKN